MYSIKLSKEDSKRLKKVIRQMMIKEDLTVTDLSERTGYGVQTLYNYFSNDRLNKFISAALCDELGITVGVNNK